MLCKAKLPAWQADRVNKTSFNNEHRPGSPSVTNAQYTHIDFLLPDCNRRQNLTQHLCSQIENVITFTVLYLCLLLLLLKNVCQFPTHYIHIRIHTHSLSPFKTSPSFLRWLFNIIPVGCTFFFNVIIYLSRWYYSMSFIFKLHARTFDFILLRASTSPLSHLLFFRMKTLTSILLQAVFICRCIKVKSLL